MRGRHLLLVALLFALSPLTARSQPAIERTCADRAQIVSQLRKQFGEQLTGHGLSHSGVLFEVFAAANGGWSLIITDASGMSCLVASGAHWQAVKSPAIEI